MTKIIDFFGVDTGFQGQIDWNDVLRNQHCPYVERTCIKVRKSQPEISIGTCTVLHGRDDSPIMICPFRLLERGQIFIDCLHLLTSHEPGNELHILSEISIPGGSVDYFLVSAKRRRVVDFVGIELQTLDTTGTVWPERQRFLQGKGIDVDETDTSSSKPYGMNWKMTAKTTLVQLHHKVETFESINKHLVLVFQDCLLSYMRKEFSFDHLDNAVLGDPMHFHAYRLDALDGGHRLELAERVSTDSDGIAVCMGLQVSAQIELEDILGVLQSRISDATVFEI